jgi:hypothetical protein
VLSGCTNEAGGSATIAATRSTNSVELIPTNSAGPTAFHTTTLPTGQAVTPVEFAATVKQICRDDAPKFDAQAASAAARTPL